MWLQPAGRKGRSWALGLRDRKGNQPWAGGKAGSGLLRAGGKRQLLKERWGQEGVHKTGCGNVVSRGGCTAMRGAVILE